MNTKNLIFRASYHYFIDYIQTVYHLIFELPSPLFATLILVCGFMGLNFSYCFFLCAVYSKNLTKKQIVLSILFISIGFSLMIATYNEKGQLLGDIAVKEARQMEQAGEPIFVFRILVRNFLNNCLRVISNVKTNCFVN